MVFLQIVLVIIAGLLILTGLVGCILPIIPGPPLSYIGILLLHFSIYGDFSLTFLIVFAILIVGVSILDNILPVIGAKRFGSSKRGILGAVLGFIVGMFFFPPFGMIIGSFLGALAGELTMGKEFWSSIKASSGTFLGFIVGIGLKIIVSGMMGFYYVVELIK